MKIWYGVIVVAYTRQPLSILVIENPARGKVSLLSGAVETVDGGSQVRAALREIREEAGWAVHEHELIATPLLHSFTYASDKPGRGGDKGLNSVFLLDASQLPAPRSSDSNSIPHWLPASDAVRAISFGDLQSIALQAIERIKQTVY